MTDNPALTCRAFGHSWDQVPSTSPPEFGVYIWLRCIHCHSHRKDIVSPLTGELLQRWYDYSDEFKETMGRRRPRATFRVQYLRTKTATSFLPQKGAK